LQDLAGIAEKSKKEETSRAFWIQQMPKVFLMAVSRSFIV
jgi:hypothetical protein